MKDKIYYVCNKWKGFCESSCSPLTLTVATGMAKKWLKHNPKLNKDREYIIIGKIVKLNKNNKKVKYIPIKKWTNEKGWFPV